MNITEATKRACEEPTLLDALSFICMWEAERAIKQALEHERSGISTAAYGDYDLCFKHCLRSVMNNYWRVVR